jgi:hypothetical protein
MMDVRRQCCSEDALVRTSLVGLPLLADIVAKVENRTIVKILRKSVFELLCRCVAFQATTEVRDQFWMKR